MHRVWLAIVFTAGVHLLLTVKAGDAAVAKLSSKDFDTKIGEQQLAFVKFYAPWCRHCQEMAPDFEKAAVTLRDRALLAEIDATVEEDLAEKYGVNSYPTIKLFSKGRFVADYMGSMETQAFVDFIDRATQPRYQLIESQVALDAYLKDKGKAAVLAGVNLQGEDLESFSRLTFTLNSHFPELAVIVVKDPSILDATMKTENGDHVLLRPTDDAFSAMKYDPKSFTSLDVFVRAMLVPSFDEFTPSNAELYTVLPFPVVFGFFRKDNALEDPSLLIMKTIAERKKDSGKLAFAWTDVDALSSFQDYVGLTNASVPICAYSFETDQVYRLPSDVTTLTESAFESWIDDLIAGDVSPRARSQPIPEKQNESGAMIVVGDSWHQVVEDPTKDVLIAQIAPWCGHCTAMKPGFHRAADELRAAGVDHIVLAMMDATENDAPNKYVPEAFPTIHFFPAGKGAKPELFDGEPSSKEFIDFLKAKSTKKFDFDTDKLGPDPTPEDDPEFDDDDELPEDGDYVDEPPADSEHATERDETADNTNTEQQSMPESAKDEL